MEKIGCQLNIGNTKFFVADGEGSIESTMKHSMKKLSLRVTTKKHTPGMLAKQASSRYEKILISIPDTDVFVICLSVDLFTDANLLLLTGVKNSKRIIDATKGADYILKSLNSCEISKEILMKSLVGFHNFTQCDAISAFAGKGKVESLK